MDIKHRLKLKTLKRAIRPSYREKVRCMEDHIKPVLKQQRDHEYNPYRTYKLSNI